MRVPLQRAPDGIQAAVLAGIRDHREGRPRGEAQRGVGGLSIGWWREWIWPNPGAWGCVAIGWVIITVAQISLPATAIPKAQVLARSSARDPMDRESLQRVREQREMLGRLLSPPAPPPAVSSPESGPQILYWNSRRRGNWENIV